MECEWSKLLSIRTKNERGRMQGVGQMGSIAPFSFPVRIGCNSGKELQQILICFTLYAISIKINNNDNGKTIRKRSAHIKLSWFCSCWHTSLEEHEIISCNPSWIHHYMASLWSCRVPIGDSSLSPTHHHNAHCFHLV